MSAAKTAAALIDELGAGTVDDILSDMDGLTRKQAIRALINAAALDLIACDGRRIVKGHRGSLPATYRSIVKTYSRPRVNSVWQLAEARG